MDLHPTIHPSVHPSFICATPCVSVSVCATPYVSVCVTPYAFVWATPCVSVCAMIDNNYWCMYVDHKYQWSMINDKYEWSIMIDNNYTWSIETNTLISQHAKVEQTQPIGFVTSTSCWNPRVLCIETYHRSLIAIIDQGFLCENTLDPYARTH